MSDILDMFNIDLSFDTLLEYFPSSGIHKNMSVYLKFNNRSNTITFSKNTFDNNLVDIFMDGDKIDIKDIRKNNSCLNIFQKDLYIYAISSMNDNKMIKIVLHAPQFYELSNMLSLTVRFHTKYFEYRCYRNLNCVILTNKIYYNYSHKKCTRCDVLFTMNDKCCIDEKIDYYHYNCFKYLPT